MSGVSNSIGDNGLECPVIKIMKAIDIEVEDRGIEAFHRISKSKGNLKKIIVRFYNRTFSKKGLYNKKKLASVNTWGIGLGNSTFTFFQREPDGLQ